MTQSILIVGATSGIAEAVARIYAGRGARLFLVARNAEKLNVIASDLSVRGASDIATYVMDANDTVSLPEMLDTAWRRFSRIDAVLIAYGTLPDQVRCETDINYAVREFRTNAESIISCLASLAIRFEKQGDGVIAVIGSVAGDRGRASNYLYGAAKAAIDTFASGLRSRLLKSGVHVLTIKPGFVDTPMTRGLPLPSILLAPAKKVAVDIVRAIEKKRDVLYTPWFWQFIMLIILHIPNLVLKRIKL
ncbi:SDR family oxidoreductase [Methylocaldum gracile]|jgi:decaprenylphospho-beta-D-erythro-pentofuranosid-2-ulose 2-reductase